MYKVERIRYKRLARQGKLLELFDLVTEDFDLDRIEHQLYSDTLDEIARLFLKRGKGQPPAPEGMVPLIREG